MSTRPSPRPWWPLAFGLVLSAVACRVTTVPPRDSIRFSHGPHLEKSIACPRCHVAAANPDTPRDASLLPSEAACRDPACHARPEQQQCRFCHTDPRHPQAFVRRARRVRFAHAPHVGRVPNGCVSCHASSATDQTIRGYRPQIPQMSSCIGSCHAREMRQLACARCHLDLHQYSLDEVSSLVSHPLGWGRRHGSAARADAGLCAQCHEPTFCARCHTPSPGLALELVEPTDVTSDFVHRGDWSSRHPMEARGNEAMCARCHGVQFCDGCHHESGVGGSVRPGSPHPAGWLDPLSPRSHAREARRDIMRCAACHESDAERLCVGCHRVGGVAGSPHPPGFGAGLDRERNGVCRACHVR